ncbi:alanine- and arginine-rich domain-containing protein [Saimiri boliviensis]|uniref:Alanine and arginine rich domain containing protein n=1 Tax=Saimiri boliviensis boliviensis TaxID=39432 RepID=A0A2K6TZP9_SAIBB|nr:alanine and arginine-rich domain-containing protein [Saimiri boliviensis boliviensis]
MDPGDFDRSSRISREFQGLPGRGELWFSPGPASGFPGDRRSPDVQEASPLLEDLRRRLARAFQWAIQRRASRRAQEAAAAALEEQSRARVEVALAGLRAELVEMHFQNHQLARTLLDLNMKVQQLKKECELGFTSDSRSPKDNAANSE